MMPVTPAMPATPIMPVNKKKYKHI